MKKILLSFILITLSLPVWADENKKESVFDHIVRTGTINCGYAMWSPMLYKDLNSNKIEGVTYEIMEEIGRRLDLKINWVEESGWGTIIEGLRTNRYDMICTAIGIISARAKFMDFSTPIYFSPIYIVVRQDDKRFDKDINSINKKEYKIATLDGDASSSLARQNFPEAMTSAMPQTSDYSLLLKEVETKKADVTIITPETFLEYDHNNPQKLKVLNKNNPILAPVALGIPLNESSLKRMIDIAITEMLLDGTIDRILKKYERRSGVFLRVANPAKVQ
jgi:ABC-type amino acid transport substrate-binding protein